MRNTENATAEYLNVCIPPKTACHVKLAAYDSKCTLVVSSITHKRLQITPGGVFKNLFIYILHFDAPVSSFADWHLIKRAESSCVCLQTGHATDCMLIVEAELA